VTPVPLTGVVLLDVTWTTANAMAPFVQDGSHDDQGNPVLRSGSRLPHRPLDLFMPGLQELFRNLQPGERLRLGVVARRIRLSAGFDGDQSALASQARKLLNVRDDERYGPTPLWDAVDEATTALTTEPGRLAVLLVTDGLSTGNRHSLADVTKRAIEAHVCVHIVHEVPGSASPNAHSGDETGNPWMMFPSNPFTGQPQVLLKELADATGGAYLGDDTTGRIYPDQTNGRWRPDPASGRAQILGKMFMKAMYYARREGETP
jgi:hypothetical protein